MSSSFHWSDRNDVGDLIDLQVHIIINIGALWRLPWPWRWFLMIPRLQAQYR